LISPSSQTTTVVPASFARLMTFRAACRKAASASFVRGCSVVFFTNPLQVCFDPPELPNLYDDQLPIDLEDDEPRRESGCIVQPPILSDRAIKSKEVLHPCRVSTSNVFERDAVPSFRDTLSDSGHRQIHIRQPQKEQYNAISARPHISQPLDVGPARERRLKPEIHL
jgi:hypothetical protein